MLVRDNHTIFCIVYSVYRARSFLFLSGGYKLIIPGLCLEVKFIFVEIIEVKNLSGSANRGGGKCCSSFVEYVKKISANW